MTDWHLPETYTFEGRSIRYGVVGDGPPFGSDSAADSIHFSDDFRPLTVTESQASNH
jgi:hypothetical protein